jgi:hypothetical protein
MQQHPVTQDKANQLFNEILEMGLPATREQIWTILNQESFN